MVDKQQPLFLQIYLFYNLRYLYVKLVIEC